MKKQIETIIDIIDNIERVKKAYQILLRKFVLDKTEPLEDRFLVWSKYCDKAEVERLGDGEFYPIGDMIESNLDNLNRGQEQAREELIAIAKELCDIDVDSLTKAEKNILRRLERLEIVTKEIIFGNTTIYLIKE